MAKEKIIDRHTGISIGLVIALLGGSVWLTNIYALANSNRSRIITEEKKNVVRDAALVSIDKSMAVFAEKLKHVDLHKK